MFEGASENNRVTMLLIARDQANERREGEKLMLAAIMDLLLDIRHPVTVVLQITTVIL